jgi:hypothetical protein
MTSSCLHYSEAKIKLVNAADDRAPFDKEQSTVFKPLAMKRGICFTTLLLASPQVPAKVPRDDSQCCDNGGVDVGRLLLPP